jgi:hypothetical protein
MNTHDYPNHPVRLDAVLDAVIAASGIKLCP